MSTVINQHRLHRKGIWDDPLGTAIRLRSDFDGVHEALWAFAADCFEVAAALCVEPAEWARFCNDPFWDNIAIPNCYLRAVFRFVIEARETKGKRYRRAVAYAEAMKQAFDAGANSDEVYALLKTRGGLDGLSGEVFDAACEANEPHHHDSLGYGVASLSPPQNIAPTQPSAEGPSGVQEAIFSRKGSRKQLARKFTKSWCLNQLILSAEEADRNAVLRMKMGERCLIEVVRQDDEDEFLIFPVRNVKRFDPDGLD